MMQATYIRTPKELEAVVTIGTTTELLVLDFKKAVPRLARSPVALTTRQLKAEAQRETCRNTASVPVPGETPWENLDSAVRTIFRVPKDALKKEEKRLKKIRQKKRDKKQSKKAA